MQVENIRPEDIFRKRKECNGILIDLRGREEYEMGFIPGAKNIPYEELEHHVPELRKLVKEKNAALILYCEHGVTSMMAARDLYREGFPVKNIYGGIQGYKGPLVKREEKKES